MVSAVLNYNKYTVSFKKILWHIDPLLDNDRGTNETRAIARQQLHKYVPVLELLPCSGPHTTMEVLLEVVFSMWSTPRLYY
jgi:hypothetical protein